MEHIAALLCELENIEKAAAVLSTGDGETVNVKTLEVRRETIKNLEKTAEEISKLCTAAVCALSAIERMKTRHREETAAVAAAVGAKNWTVVPRRRVQAGVMTLKDIDSKYTRVKVTDTVMLCAISVPTFDSVKGDGELYYVATCGHFALRVSGVLFHGNIGNIFTDEKTPDKIKDCRFAETCAKKSECDYYHNPRRHLDSQDHRNFVASSWLYNGSDPKRRNRGRRFGSRASLDVDIIGLQQDEIDRFRDQVMHDILCVFALAGIYNIRD